MELDERQRDRLSTEWLTVCALKEVINVAQRGNTPSTYRKALALAEELVPEHFAPERRLLAGAPESINARLYRQLASLESAGTGVLITAYEFARREYSRLSRQIEDHEADLDDIALAKSRLAHLETVMLELRPRQYSEHKSIFGDVLQVERNLPVSGEGRDYKQYALDDHRILRIRVLHPDPDESKTGADVFYEHLDEGTRRARLAIVQFKIWDGASFHREDRMAGQMDRMEAFACRNHLCDLAHDSRRLYRLPPCTAFLRPTDRIQDPDAKMYSSGLHVPLCVVKDAWEPNRNGGMSVRRGNIEDRSLSNEVFEKLFNSKLLGGKELPFKELEGLYERFELFEYDDTVQIHAQEFRQEPEEAGGGKKARKSAKGSGRRKGPRKGASPGHPADTNTP